MILSLTICVATVLEVGLSPEVASPRHRLRMRGSSSGPPISWSHLLSRKSWQLVCVQDIDSYLYIGIGLRSNNFHRGNWAKLIGKRHTYSTFELIQAHICPPIL